jgi:Ca-activated chloride channel family protein
LLRQYLQHISFDWPWALLLLALIPFLAVFLLRSGNSRQPRFLLANTTRLQKLPQGKARWRHLPTLTRLLALACLVVALARPARYSTIELTRGNGIDLVLCLDVSGSMLARDFEPDRLRASINVARQFVGRRKGDRVGLVAFSGQSLSLCPLTTDHKVVLQQLGKIEYGMLADGTAIGSGLASAVDRLRAGDAKSKVVILLTDGENTGGMIDPPTAKELAKTYGIKVYTIGVGTMGYAPMPYQTPSGEIVMQQEKVSIDEKLLGELAAETGGQYYRATDNKKLEEIYSSIDQLEKSKIETTTFRKRTDEFFPWLMAAMALLLLEALLHYTWLRTLA